MHKYFVVVELLMGDIPERALFRQPVLRKALVPYFQIVQGKFSPSSRPDTKKLNPLPSPQPSESAT